MVVSVLRSIDPAGKHALHGIYSTRAKAKLAATGMMIHQNQMAAKPGKWAVHDEGSKISYINKKNSHLFLIEPWETDKALMDGKWVVL